MTLSVSNHPCDRYLDEMRAECSDMREQGRRFEDFCRNIYFKQHPVYAARFESVETYADWAAKHDEDGTDRGIDLVATMTGGDGYAAIQCKFVGANTDIKKNEVDKFIASAPRDRFIDRIFIHTSDVEPRGQIPRIFTENNVTHIPLHSIRRLEVNWDRLRTSGKVERPPKKSMREHQETALKNVVDGFREHDRGHVVMACGTGKTFTALKIAETMAGKGGVVLVLVPTLALMSQCVREWHNDADTKFAAIAACSKKSVGKSKVKSGEDAVHYHTDFPVETDSDKVASYITSKMRQSKSAERMLVVFSTYHSIGVIADAQKRRKDPAPEFDLVICDEAHRTTGVTLVGKDESNFVKVHNNDIIKAKRRLYMTATPRIYSGEVKDTAKEADATLASMDDESKYGTMFYRLKFSDAVEKGLLTDYKVVVLMLNEDLVSASQQRERTDDEGLDLGEGTKVIGCYKALTKIGWNKEDLAGDSPRPMKRALAFCNTLKFSGALAGEKSGDGKETKEGAFKKTIRRFLESEYGESYRKGALQCEVAHVGSDQREKTNDDNIDLLKNDIADGTCQILTNVRCLGEGVDVPALDAVMFLHARNSQVDVVQAVGRVMRKSPDTDKKLGYVILPVGVPAGDTPENVLSHSKKYKVVWQVINALRSHDEELDAVINRAVLGERPKKGKFDIIWSDDPTQRGNVKDPVATQGILPFNVHEWSRAVMTQLVKKVGTRSYWQDWASTVGENAQQYAVALTNNLRDTGTDAREAFDMFLKELRDDINDDISEKDAIEMLSQHSATKPVFHALFHGEGFVSKNPVSVAMDKVLDKVNVGIVGIATKDHKKFQKRIDRDLGDNLSPEARQTLVKNLYDLFFSEAFPKVSAKLGIVYTPVEIVDFILRSVNEALQEHFGQTLGAEGVHIIDPFTGTGTFITRLLQLGLISPQEIKHKFNNEIHANEIVLLAYYIAAINIESVYGSVMEEASIKITDDESIFNGICLTDTFQLHDRVDQFAEFFPDNSERRTRQRKLDIKVIVGNPPYHVGQESGNDNNANTSYPNLDDRIRETFGKGASATLLRGLFDSYIRAIRWGSDRLKDKGIMSFVINGGWIDGKPMSGLRKCLAEEYSNLYIFNLRGNIREPGDVKGGNVFGSDATTAVAIFLLVKNPNSKTHGKIHYHDIGGPLTTKEKLEIIQGLGSMRAINEEYGWEIITPNKHGDWINQRDDSFRRFTVLGDRKNRELRLFSHYSLGVSTGRDAWCYNSSPTNLTKNVKQMIAFYHQELDRLNSHKSVTKGGFEFNRDKTKISWTRSLENSLMGKKVLKFENGDLRISLYKPFTKRWMYFDRKLNDSVSLNPSIFPEPSTKNLAICVSGQRTRATFSVMMTDVTPNAEVVSAAQAFALWRYDNPDKSKDELFSNQSDPTAKVSTITDDGLQSYRSHYKDEEITKEDIFYHVYGLLHSEQYRSRFKGNLNKELPRIPMMKRIEDFRRFTTAGRNLGKLHVDFETAKPYPVQIEWSRSSKALKTDPKSLYRVEKPMRFVGRGKTADRSQVIYNEHIKVTGIPLAAYEYSVDGMSALKYVMNRQCVKIDKKQGSDIVNDPNLYAIETMGDPAYPLELFKRIITVSLETIKIVKGLPDLDID